MSERQQETETPQVKVVDRRRLNQEGTERNTEETVTAPPREAAAESDASFQDTPTTTPPLLAVPDLVRIFLAELHMRAWVHLGLIAHPESQVVAKDLPQARLAIDCIAALVNQLSPTLSPAERDELQRMLNDLRLNFVQQSAS